MQSFYETLAFVSIGGEHDNIKTIIHHFKTASREYLYIYFIYLLVMLSLL